MFRNYFKTAYRNLLKNKGFTFINVFGLTLGLATCLLIVFYVFDELSYDRYNTKAACIYRVNDDIKFGGMENSFAVAPTPVAAALKADFPEIEQAVRFRYTGANQVRKDVQNMQEDKMVYADSNIFKVFTLPMLYGNPDKALIDPHTVVMTEDMARKYFNRADAVGQVLTLNDSVPYKVTGVIRNIPQQSHFHYDFYMSMSSLPESTEDAWFSNSFFTYILLKPNSNPKALAAKFPDFMVRHGGAQLQSILHMDFKTLEKNGSYFRLSLTPLLKIHLQSDAIDGIEPNGDIAYIYIFSATAIFILLIACVNFMNLSTARSASRAREVGIRKVLGSPRRSLIFQFLIESILLTLLAAAIAVLGAWACLGLFNDISGKQLLVTSQILGWLIPALFIIIIVVGCLAGLYPALFLSGFQPVKVLKGAGGNRRGIKGAGLRSLLVVVQFTISIFLIIGTLVISNQLKFIQKKDMGYDRDHVLLIENVWALGNDAQSFKQEIKQLAGVQDAGLSNALPTDNNSNGTTFFKDPVVDQKRSVSTFEWNIDEDFIPTLGIKMAAGRNFSKDMPTDSLAVVINQAFAKQLGYGNPVNQPLYTFENQAMTKMTKYHIIGVVKDFNFKSLKTNITPLIFMLNQDIGTLSVRVKTNDIPSLLALIKDKWKKSSPNRQFSYTFLDQNFDALYRAEQRTGAISMAFTSLAIIIACLGLFGLAAYDAEQRTKEIGIRKVLGADVSTIVNLLSKDFIKLVLIAIAIAVPLGWWAMHTWLEKFAYRQDIQWWVPVLAGVSAMAIAFITISYQSVKAALTNPIKNLRSE